ncbi:MULTISPECIES: 4Fe-4S binding protein [unclassified Methanoculleus]|uniref:4Fe-4S binding protein n=1 Tax=unclassified Methanoculleus TaxID=2619537 RepID=UPI0025E9D86A|nr:MULTISPECIES: 4Fe-4S binding protein [unclassified Methanoculleus]
MANESKIRPALRQRVRKALLILSFVLLPVTFVYISCPIITEGASQGIATGGLFMFTFLFIGSLFFGRLWCGYLCPAGGLQEIYFGLNSTRFKIEWLNWLKYPIFLGIYGSIAVAIYSAGGLSTIDLFYQTGNGISIDRPGAYTLLYAQIAFITVFALLAGRRGFCHSFCPIAVMLIIGRKVRNLVGWPALRLAADAERCVDCGRCSETCPMSLDVRGMVREGRMEDAECILCGGCVDTCPQDAVRYAWRGRP